MDEEVKEELNEPAEEVVEQKEESIMSLESLKEAYIAKNEEIKEKYKDVIAAISVKQDKDLGVAFDMLKAVYRGGKEYLDGIDVEFDMDELMKDCAESMELSIKIADLVGLN